MKVIKDGTKLMEVTCGNCNSELQYEQDDINKEVFEDCSTVVNEKRVNLFKKEYWSRLYEITESYIICPICSERIVVKTNCKVIGKKTLRRKDLVTTF